MGARSRRTLGAILRQPRAASITSEIGAPHEAAAALTESLKIRGARDPRTGGFGSLRLGSPNLMTACAFDRARPTLRTRGAAHLPTRSREGMLADSHLRRPSSARGP